MGDSELVMEERVRDNERRTDLISKALSIYSPSGDEEPFAKFLFQELASTGLSPVTDRAGNVICTIGSGTRTLLLCGHMDTVPGELPVKIQNGEVFGRGACDAKGPLLSMLFAFEDLSKRCEILREGKVIFAAATEEERNSAGLTEIIRNNLRADYAIFGEPCGVSKVTIGYRGHLSVQILIETPEAHGSAPWLTTNSAELAYQIYESLKQRWRSDNKGSKNNDVTVSLTEIHAGTAHNIVPGRTTMTLDVRIPFGTGSKGVASEIDAVLQEVESKNRSSKIKATFDEPTEPYRTKMNSDLVRAISRAILKLGHEKPSFISKSGTGDMNTYALAFGVDAITYGPGDTKLSHTQDEHVSLNEIFTCSEVLVKSAEELFTMKLSEKR